ncbi:hypothetical protein V1514DRAFT_325503 [Lipomyces japonicus]|uniref:uncharacterized protein n=1 Tax=Lipomyces japonicus TaxID=56871 RepID=UPI0034CE73A5
MAAISSQIENLPGYGYVMDAWNEFADEKLQTKDPYFEELPDGSTRRRQVPEGTTPSDAAVLKHITSTAWKHDRCLCGCFWADWGIGQAPLISIVPVFGPWIMYTMHLRLNRMAEDLQIPTSLHVKMTANVTFDFLLTLVPVLGAVFSYLNACSTRNAALVHTFLVKRGKENQAVSTARVHMHMSLLRFFFFFFCGFTGLFTYVCSGTRPVHGSGHEVHPTFTATATTKIDSPTRAHT